MKTSILVLAALFLNTALLFAEPLFAVVKNIDSTVFIAIEAALLVLYIGNKFLGDFSRAVEVNLGQLEIVVYKKRR